MNGPSPTRPFHVVIAGGGVAALETLLALRSRDPRHALRMTLIAPQEQLTYRPLAVLEPFGEAPRRFRLDRICADVGAELHQGTLAAVDPAAGTLTTGGGERVGCDALVIATGARQQPGLPHAHTFRSDHAPADLHWLLRDVELGEARRVAFVAPADCGWTLPLYELALLTARRAYDMSMDDVELTLVTPEDAPLAIFRGEGSAAVARLLDDAGVALRLSRYAHDYDGRRIALTPGGETLEADLVVALPRLEGPALEGLPSDAAGFVRTDEHGRVHGAAEVYAIGDATAFPIKQGGIAAQQADVVAALIANAAGLGSSTPPTRPKLRAILLTGGDPLYLQATITGGESVTSTASRTCPWWPPHKIAARHLAPYLADRGRALADSPRARVELVVDERLGTS